MLQQIQCVTAQLQSLHRQHKEYQCYKQLVKRQSNQLEQYITQCDKISIQFQSQLFKPWVKHLSDFQRDLMKQYLTLKQSGKQFYVVKEEIALFLKTQSKALRDCEKKVRNLEEHVAKINDQQQSFNANQFKLDQTLKVTQRNQEFNRFNQELKQKQIQLNETQQFWTSQLQINESRMNDQQQHGVQLIHATNQLVSAFYHRHKFLQVQSQNSSANKPQQSQQHSHMRSLSKQQTNNCITRTLLPFDDGTIVSQFNATDNSINQRVDFTESENMILKR